MTSKARDTEPSRCIYCGVPTRGTRTCASHRDLETIDPELVAERPALTDAEQGARSQWRSLSRRSRRRR